MLQGETFLDVEEKAKLFGEEKEKMYSKIAELSIQIISCIILLNLQLHSVNHTALCRYLAWSVS